MNRLIKTPQWKSGQDVEKFLDEYYSSRGFSIERLSDAEERQQHLGDRRFIRDGQAFLVEYKSGLQTSYTGNIFLETISVDTANIPGWVYTCQADYIFYACLPLGKILIFIPDDLRARIEGLKNKFKTVSTSKGQNVGYKTWGVIIPLEYAETELAHKIVYLK